MAEQDDRVVVGRLGTDPVTEEWLADVTKAVNGAPSDFFVSYGDARNSVTIPRAVILSLIEAARNGTRNMIIVGAAIATFALCYAFGFLVG